MKTVPVTILSVVLASASLADDFAAVPMDDWVRGLPLKIAAAPGQYEPNGKIRHITFHHTHTPTGDGTRESEIVILNNQVHSSSLYTWEEDSRNPQRGKARYYRRKGAAGMDIPKHGGTAYHYLIGNSGTIYKGRPDDIAPASNTYYYSDKEMVGSRRGIGGKVILTEAMAQRVASHRSATFETWKSRTNYERWLEGERQVLRRRGVSAGTEMDKALAKRIEEQKTRLVSPGNTKGHLTICFIGGDARPTDEALNAAARLSSELLRKHRLEPEAVRTHCEVANTDCPGNGVQSWVRQRNRNGERGSLFGMMRKHSAY